MTDLKKEEKLELINKEVKDLTDDEFEIVSDMQGSGEAQKLLKDAKDTEDEAPEEETLDTDDDDESEKKSKSKPDKKGKDKEETEDEDEEEDKEIDDKKSKNYKIPLSKHQRKVKKLEESHKQAIDSLTKDFTGKIEDLQSKIVDASQAKSKAETKKSLKKLAKESGLDYKVLQGVVDITRKELNIDTSKIENIHKTQEESMEKTRFEADFTDSILETLQDVNSNISSGQLKKAKARVKELAYSDQYVNYSLKDIYKLNKTEIDKLVGKLTKKKSAEGSRPNSQRGTDLKSKPMSEMNTEEMAALSDEDFEKLSNEEAEGQSNIKVMRKGVQVN